MTLDEKLTHTKARVDRLTKSLKCCSWTFFLFGIMLFFSAVNTFYSAKWNAAHIAETGFLPWGPSQVKDFTPSNEPVAHVFDLYDNFNHMAVTMIFSAISLFCFSRRTTIAAWC
jgi:hypothetical protein